MFEKLTVLLAYPAFEGSIRKYIPNLKVVGKDPVRPSEADLIIFSGGEDINPNLYGKANTGSHGCNPHRDGIEWELLKVIGAMRSSEYATPKIFGICRGHQIINAHMGGKLIQDIWSELSISHGGEHGLRQIDKTQMLSLFPEGVNSMHHQAVSLSTISPRLIPTTVADDCAIVESYETEQVMGVQFHPEFMGSYSLPFWKYLEAWAMDKPDKKKYRRNNPYDEYFSGALQKQIRVEIDEAVFNDNLRAARARRERERGLFGGPQFTIEDNREED